METNKTFDKHKYDYLFLEHCNEEQKHSIMRELGYEFSHETSEIKININFLKFVEDNGLICHSKRIEGELHSIVRKHTIENLYWLLGRDCEKEEWEKFIWRKHQGILYGVDLNNKYESAFFSEEEYKAALNSFNNK